MNLNTKNLLKQLLTRLSLVLAAVGFCWNAAAENLVTMTELSIKLNETKRVAVKLENSDAISALQLDVTLPEGIALVENSITRNEERLIRGVHSVTMTAVPGKQRTYRIMIAPMDMSNIVGNEGAVVYFDVTNTGLTDGSFIGISELYASRFEVDSEGKVQNFLVEDLNSENPRIVPHVGRLYMGEDALAIKTDGSAKKVDVGLVNYLAVRGMQGDITLPDGLSFVVENGRAKFDYSDRLQSNATITGNIVGQTMHFAVSDLSAETIKGDSGVVFSFYVKASETLAESSEIVLNEGIVSDDNAADYAILDEAKIKVINSYLAYFTPANDSVQGLRDRYDAAVEKIDTEAAAVKDSALVVDGKAAIEKDIEALAGAVEAAYNDETLAANFDAILAPVVEIDEAIVALVDTALAYQQTLSANEAAYGRLQADIEALQTQLDEAKAQLEAECPDVAAWFTDSIADIQADIDSVNNEVKALYDAMKLTEESAIDGTQIVAAIETLVADAIKAQTESTLDAYYALANDSITGLRGRYDAAVEKIAAEAAAVKDSALVTEAMAAIEADMDALQKSVDEAYNEATLVENFAALLAPVVDIDTAIVAMVDEALAFGKKVVANNEAYTRLTADIAALQTKLDAAEAQINKECAAVAGQYTETIAALQADVDSITAAVKAQYEAIELTAESKIDGTAIESGITAMVEAAVAGQQKVVANNEAYTRLTADIAALQTKLDAAEAQINKECAAVAGQYTETIAALQADVDSITAAVKAQYEAIELTAESKIDGTAIESGITAMVEAAVAGQQKVVANNEAYTRLTADIAALQAKLDAAEAKIMEECFNVSALFTDSIEAIQAEIDTISANVKAQYEAIELTAESKIDGTAIEAAITEVVEAAIYAQQTMSANEAAYQRLMSEIEDLWVQLDNAQEKLATECKDVAANYAETINGFYAELDSISDAVEAQYEATELTAESTINGEAIEAAIAEMVEDAVAAQKVITDNNEAYTRLTASIAALQTKLDAAETQITTECADVAANYTATIEAIQADIDSISADVKAQYEAVELTAESAIDSTAIETAITAMVEAAVAGQQVVGVNNEAYTRLTADIAALQAKLDAAETQITTECADVAANYTATIEAIQVDIDSITAEVKAQYEALELTAESAIDGAAIEAAISEMVETAVAGQEAYEANEEAYARLTEDIAELQAKLDAAEEQIAEECPDVADRFTETLEALQADIDSISEEVEAQYEAIELTAESAIDGTEIEAAIEKAIEDAIEAQKEFSGIDSVLMDVENGKAKIYSISGQLLDAPVKGQVNIFKYTDGRVVKFYMK